MKKAFIGAGETRLRQLDQTDAPALTRWLEDPEVRRALLGDRPDEPLPEQYRDEVAKSEGDLLFAIAEPSGALLGVCALHTLDQQERSAGMSIFIGEPSQRSQGHGSRAVRLILEHGFGELGLERIWLEVALNNPAAIKAYRKVGFVEREDSPARHGGLPILVMEVRRRDFRMSPVP